MSNIIVPPIIGEKYDELFKAIAEGTLVVDNTSDPNTHPVTEKVNVIYE